LKLKNIRIKREQDYREETSISKNNDFFSLCKYLNCDFFVFVFEKNTNTPSLNYLENILSLFKNLDIEDISKFDEEGVYYLKKRY
jgi:hypothetical protein